jgi:hypothetical protein
MWGGAMRCHQWPASPHPNPLLFNYIPLLPTPSRLPPLVYQGMSTPSRIEINQANSQYSTGPKSDAGKQRSSLNALRHGLTSKIVVMPAENPQAYQSHLKSLTDEYHPKGATETLLTQALADAAWRLNRVGVLEANLLTASVEDQSKALANLSLHSQRLSRQFERTLAQLRDLQKIRRSHENDDLDNLLDIMEMYESKGETYEPSEDGFVFSQTQINSKIRARNRERLVEEAFAHLHGDTV